MVVEPSCAVIKFNHVLHRKWLSTPISSIINFEKRCIILTTRRRRLAFSCCTSCSTNMLFIESKQMHVGMELKITFSSLFVFRIAIWINWILVAIPNLTWSGILQNPILCVWMVSIKYERRKKTLKYIIKWVDHKTHYNISNICNKSCWYYLNLI